MAQNERSVADQEFGGQAAQGQERANRAESPEDPSGLATEVNSKEPRAAGTAEPAEQS